MTHELNHAGAPARASDDEKMDGAAASPVAGSQSSGHAADADAHLGGAHGEAVDREHRWWSMEEDRRVRRKLDMRILPILFVTYLLAALDRSNIGNAKTAGMNKDLHISSPQFQWLLTMFYIGYALFQWLLLALKIFPPSRWMSGCVFVWGLASVLQSTATGWSGLMACRFFLGVAEAGFGTATALYYSFFYPKEEIGFRFAIFLTSSALGSCIAGSIAYGIQQTHSAVEPWRLLFIVEGLPTIIVAFIVLFFLPDSIATASFLTPRERFIAEARLFRETVDRSAAARLDEHAVVAGQEKQRFGALRAIRADLSSKLDFSNAKGALLDPMAWTSSILLFIVNVSYSSVPVYLPTFINELGYTSIRSQGLSAPPYLVAWVMALAIVYVSDRLMVRGVFVCGMFCVGIAGYAMLAVSENVHVRYGATYLVVLSLFTDIPLIYMLNIHNSVGESRRGVALVALGVIGQCGPFLGVRLFPDSEKPLYRKGMWTSMGILIGGAVISATAAAVLTVRNKRRDAAQAELERSEGVAVEKRADPEDERWRQKLDVARRGEASIYYRYQV